jgi:eukaryotic-like serine/threonine-protein kinase
MLEWVDDLLDSLLDRQRQSWLDGNRVPVEALLDESALAHDAETLLDLIYNEIVVREELGEQPSAKEYSQRYPHLQEEIELHFEVHRAVHDDLLVDTARAQPVESVPDLEIQAPASKPELPDYEMVGWLGQGGMGVVYQARHRGLRRHVALKMFQPGRLPSPREVLRFRTEAEAIARLQHPNIVQIFEVGECGGLPFLALELAEQGTLAQKLQQLPFTPRAAAELVETLARAVHHAHEHHIVHRDLKPANVLFTRDGTPKITDFGLAKILQADDPETRRDMTCSGEPIGTPRYMAPEQASGRQEHVGPATDVYALGTLLYECLTGQVPFVAASVLETLVKIRGHEPLPPRRLQPSIPRDLETICMGCLHKEPGRRYGSARALADDLRRFLQGEPIRARPTPAWECAWKWCRRHPARAGLVALGALLVGTGLAVAIVGHHVENRRLAGLREEVTTLMKEGREALVRGEVDHGQARIRAAWIKVQAEPALQDHLTGVVGWLLHAQRAADQRAGKLRIPPREYDELRDQAMLQSLLLDPLAPRAVPAARQAIQAALELTIAGDPAWCQEREQMVLLDAELLRRAADAERALARLDEVVAPASRRFHELRAIYLEELGRNAEAEVERQRAAQFPPEETLALFQGAVDRVRRRDFDGAVRAFDQVLGVEPEHFTARLFQAACLLHQKRPAEAKTALTACLAQRPRFVCSYLFRGQAWLQLGETAAAVRDVQRALELVPENDREAFWRDRILANPGFRPLRDLPAFQGLAAQGS